MIIKKSLPLQAQNSKSGRGVTIAFEHSGTSDDITYVNNVNGEEMSNDAITKTSIDEGTPSQS